MSHLSNPPCEDALVQAAPDHAPCTAATRRWVLAASVTGSSMAFIDGTVVNVALPVLQTELSASVAGLQWIVESYMLLLGSLILVGGALGDRFGRRRLFAIGTVIFAVTSVWCGLAPDAGQLIAAAGKQNDRPTIVVRKTDDGSVVATLGGHEAPITSLATGFSMSSTGRSFRSATAYAPPSRRKATTRPSSRS